MQTQNKTRKKMRSLKLPVQDVEINKSFLGNQLLLLSAADANTYY
jgi:hypothetical protein